MKIENGKWKEENSFWNINTERFKKLGNVLTEIYGTQKITSTKINLISDLSDLTEKEETLVSNYITNLKKLREQKEVKVSLKNIINNFLTI